MCGMTDLRWMFTARTRRYLSASTLLLGSVTLSGTVSAQAPARVVVVGGGFAGATEIGRAHV